MNRVVICSDLHFHNYKNTKNHISTETVFDVFNQIVDYCLKEKIKKILILGDLFHVRGKISVVVFNRVHDLLKEVVSKGIEVGILSGNHDHVYNEEEATTSIYSLQQIQGVTLLDWKVFTIGKIQFVALPYLHDRTKFLEGMTKYRTATLDTNLQRVLLTHGTIQGSKISYGYQFQNGLGLKDGLSLFNKVFAGHIHEPQDLFGGNVMLPGAPLCHSKKDMNSFNRGFIVLDCDTLETKREKTNHPVFIQESISSEEEFFNGLKSISTEDFVFLTITADIPNLVELLQKNSEYHIECDIVVSDKQQTSRLDVTIGNSEEKIIEDYINKFKGSLDKEFLQTTASKLLTNYQSIIKE